MWNRAPDARDFSDSLSPLVVCGVRIGVLGGIPTSLDSAVVQQRAAAGSRSSRHGHGEGVVVLYAGFDLMDLLRHRFWSGRIEAGSLAWPFRRESRGRRSIPATLQTYSIAPNVTHLAVVRESFFS